MLSLLHIQNYALIEDLELNLKTGLNIITGETGAGKSILLGALGMLSGKRADVSVVRGDAKKCVIEGEFEVGAYGLKEFFEKYDLDFEETSIIRREILASGKSRAFVNDSPVNLSVLKELGESLIDIHSQHANLLLADPKFGFSLLDSFAGQIKSLKEYQEVFKIWQKNIQKLNELEQIQQKEKMNLEFNQFQLKELVDANLKEGEQEELERDFEVLNNAEEIRENASLVAQKIVYQNDSVQELLQEAEVALGKLSEFSPEYEELKNRLSSALIELKDIAEDVEAKGGSISGDSQRVQEIDERLGLLFTLQKKFVVATVEQLIDKREELESLVSLASGDSAEIDDLKQLIEADKAKLLKLAVNLSEKRKKASKSIEKAVVADLKMMGIEQAQLSFNFETSDLTINGSDKVSVLFSANKGKELAPLAKSASGGELSRVMLSLKRILSSKSAMPTIVFDEIDTGVSGEVADKMGTIMHTMGKGMQVLTITHLPQIAAKGDAHFKVFKSHNSQISTSQLKELTQSDRVEEIAQMLSGSKVSKAALENAEELLK